LSEETGEAAGLLAEKIDTVLEGGLGKTLRELLLSRVRLSVG
jgi:hypothetical protein